MISPSSTSSRARSFVDQLDRFGLAILAIFVLVVLPLALDTFRLGLAAKYLCFAFPAIGIVLLWGY
ncbi:MAG: urea ABC transporter permease subunit UrtC, partial [Gammaproteobacteria bacterium]